MGLNNHRTAILTAIFTLLTAGQPIQLLAQTVTEKLSFSAPTDGLTRESSCCQTSTTTTETAQQRPTDFDTQRQDPTLRETREVRKQQLQGADFFDQSQERLDSEIQKFRQQQSLPILGLEDGVQPWQPIVFRAGGFLIWMPPGILAEESRVVETEAGALEFRIFAKDLRDSRYLAAYTELEDLQETVTQEQAEDIFTRILNVVIERTASEPTDIKDITVSGYPGREVTLMSDTETINFRLLLIEQKIYFLGVEQTTANQNTAAVSAFFSSFQLY